MIARWAAWKRNVALALLAALFLWFCWEVRGVLNPLLLGYLFAYILHPSVLKLERRGWSRRSAVNLIFAVSALSGLAIGAGAFVQARALGRELARSEAWDRAEERLEAVLVRAQGWLPTTGEPTEDEPEIEDAAPTHPEGAPSDDLARPTDLADGGGPVERVEAGGVDPALDGDPGLDEDPGLLGLLRDFWMQLSAEQATGAGRVALRGASDAWELVRRWFGSLWAFGTLFALLPLYTYFLLFELDRIHTFVQRYVPVRERDRASRIGRQIGEVIANFFRGRLLVCFVKGALLSAGLLLAGFDYALLIGMASGLLSLVPFAGPFLGFVFAVLVGLIDPDLQFVWMLVRLLIVFGGAELIEGYVLVPKILGDSLGLHPVVVLVSVFAGGAAFGMLGLLLALPVTAAIVILCRELVLPSLAEFADEGSGSVDPRL